MIQAKKGICFALGLVCFVASYTYHAHLAAQPARLNIIQQSGCAQPVCSLLLQNTIDTLLLDQVLFDTKSASLISSELENSDTNLLFSVDVNSEDFALQNLKQFENLGFQLRGIERLPNAEGIENHIGAHASLVNQEIQKLKGTHPNAAFHADIFADNETVLQYLDKIPSINSAINYDLSLALSSVLATTNINDYLAQGGIHNSIEVLSQHLARSFEYDDKVSLFLLSPTLPSEVPVELSLKKLNIFQSITSLLNFSQEFDLGTLLKLKDLSSLASHQQTLLDAKKRSFERLGNADTLKVVDAGTLLGVSLSNTNGPHFIIINVDEYSKHALPASFFNAGDFENIVTGDEVSRQSNPVLQPSEFLILTYQP